MRYLLGAYLVTCLLALAPQAAAQAPDYGAIVEPIVRYAREHGGAFVMAGQTGTLVGRGAKEELQVKGSEITWVRVGRQQQIGEPCIVTYHYRTVTKCFRATVACPAGALVRDPKKYMPMVMLVAPQILERLAYWLGQKPAGEREA